MSNLTKVLENKELGRGNRWLKLAMPDAIQLDHEPGTVVGLSIQYGSRTLSHAYTVSRVDPKNHTLEFLYRVIPEGRMTPHLATLTPGASIQLHERGGHPISGEVDTNPEGIVLVSTGTGLGPLYGYSQLALALGLEIPIKIFAGFRQEQDLCLQHELQQLAGQYPHFKYHFSLSQPGPAWPGLRGRITETMPALLGPIRNMHFHLVGNGDMVVEIYKALILAGLKDERVTSEIYFNYPEGLDPSKLESLASKFTW